MHKLILPLSLLALAGLLASLAFNAEDNLVSWSLLAKVEIKQGLFGETETTFDPAIKSLEQKDIRLAGFMFPLQSGEKVRRFILSAKQPTCATCMPGGADEMVLVNSQRPVKVSTDRMQIKGKFKIAQEMGLLYRLDSTSQR
ncbi:DUF3299 domain-containing protein [Iodobacter fluviatilis]|uniref:Uncharacterized protein conserved in bacteria n=1 Tax=Iodobacter fluviatilis TaxID=537 RepID=A0A377Q9I0_9NEIS|nr:DUF3299 domain-containing protein [Iodobacter fluviatilis]TCU88452.1 hypothetical protein EV682_10335 [Iodobacter fluviatilis]STQ91477.1 Uncharacterized protein conserved in bacteria [Iodobacter fluviatilis]